MCFVSSRVVYGQTVPALSLLFAAQAVASTRTARDFLALLLLRRSRRTLRVASQDSPHCPQRNTATIADLPTELIHLVSQALMDRALFEAQAEWEESFRQAHDLKGHDRALLAPVPAPSTFTDAASLLKSPCNFIVIKEHPKEPDEVPDGEPEFQWWNGCPLCAKMRSDALSEFSDNGDPRFGRELLGMSRRIQDLRSYLQSRGLDLACEKPLEYMTDEDQNTAHHRDGQGKDGMYVVCLRSPSRHLSGHISHAHSGWPAPGSITSPGPSSVEADASRSTSTCVVFTDNEFVTVDLADCSVDEDEGEVAYVEDASESEAAWYGDFSIPSTAELRRFDRVGRETGLLELRLASGEKCKWLRTVQVDCRCQ